MLEPRGVFGNEPVEEFMQVIPGGRVGVLHDNKAAAGVADENRQNTLRDAAALQKIPDGSGDLDSSLAAGFYFDGLVPDKERFHDGTSGLEPKQGKLNPGLPARAGFLFLVI